MAIRQHRGVVTLVAVGAIAAAAAALATPVGAISKSRPSSVSAQAAGARSAGASPRAATSAKPQPATASPAGSPRPSAAAKPTTDLTVTVTNKADAVAGKRVTYTVLILNHGPARARGLKIDFSTSASLKKVKTHINYGYCDSGHKKTVCHWNRSLKAGKAVSVTISGIMPKTMATGTQVTNTVSVVSSTKRVNKSDDKATDNYQLGIGRTPLVAATSPTPTPNPTGKLAQISNAAKTVANYTTHAVFWTLIALGAAALWFAVGLALHHRRRVADADFDNNDDGD
jgi:hypothetical protein